MAEEKASDPVGVPIRLFSAEGDGSEVGLSQGKGKMLRAGLTEEGGGASCSSIQVEAVGPGYSLWERAWQRLAGGKGNFSGRGRPRAPICCGGCRAAE